jgi:enamine deaminase RidA (YjgF/YER057c/UK114 family)
MIALVAFLMLPQVVVVDTQRLVFHVSPLTATGDLAHQTRTALQALVRKSGGAPIVKLRAFVTESGPADGVRAAVDELVSKRRMKAPVLTVVLVGGLPLEGAKVVLESTVAAKRAVNPQGLAFVAGQPASTEKPVAEMAPLIEQSIVALRAAHGGVGLEAQDILRVTCFMSSLADIGAVRSRIESAFPQAAANYVQLQRPAAARGLVECETAGRLRAPPGEALKLVNPEGLPKSPNYSHVALVGASRVALTGQQVVVGLEDSAARGGFQEVGRALEQAGASIKNVAMSTLYPVSPAGADLARKIRFEFYDRSRPPASTMLVFEGSPVAGASFAIDIVAPVR